jgi:hypothetical protein
LHTAGVAADGGKISGGLAIEESEFAKVVAAESVESVLLDVSEERLKTGPVGLTFFQPGDGNHRAKIIVDRSVR